MRPCPKKHCRICIAGWRPFSLKPLRQQTSGNGNSSRGTTIKLGFSARPRAAGSRPDSRPCRNQPGRIRSVLERGNGLGARDGANTSPYEADDRTPNHAWPTLEQAQDCIDQSGERWWEAEIWRLAGMCVRTTALPSARVARSPASGRRWHCPEQNALSWQYGRLRASGGSCVRVTGCTKGVAIWLAFSNRT